MPQELTQTIRNTFVKGLVTEFSELNFPEDASVDECNCELHRDGSRSKRLAVALEQGDTASSNSVGYAPVHSVHEWRGVGKDPEVNYIALQVGGMLYFYEKGAYPMSNGEVSGSVTLTDYNFPDTLGASEERVSTTSVNGDFVVTSKNMYPIRVVKNPSGGFEVIRIDPEVRDFTYFTDLFTTGDDKQSADLYDSLNCGWVAPPNGTSPLDTYQASYTSSTFPPLTHPWHSGKDSNGDFDVDEWEKIYVGTSKTVNGHYILPLFDQNSNRFIKSAFEYDFTNPTLKDIHDNLLQISNQDIEVAGGPAELKSGLTSCESFAGRVFFGGPDAKVYFSPLLISKGNASIGEFYQENDPTSEEFSDLLSTDGGFISFPDASDITRLSVFGASLLVFAKNGVWRITGVDGVFKATEYSAYKVTDYGLAFPDSLVIGANRQPFWWSHTGIHTIVVDENGFFREISVSRPTIQTYWDNIALDLKKEVTGFHDELGNTVSWLYPSVAEGTKNQVLNFNVDLGSFYPWKLSDSADGHQIVAGFFNRGDNTRSVDFTVVDSDGDTVVDASGDTVIYTKEVDELIATKITLVVRRSDSTWSFGEFSGTDFLDWGTADYSAYAEAAYNWVGDLARRKNSPYITAIMKVTETGWTLDGATYSPVRPSSLKVTSYWDFSSTRSASPEEVYRLKYPQVITALDNFDYPTSNIMTRLKLRGRGRVMKLRFDGQTGKDFKLLGWETLDAKNPGY